MSTTDLAQLAQDAAPLLALSLPYLVKGAKLAGKEAFKKIGEVLAEKGLEKGWDKAQKLWEKLCPQIEKQPAVQERLARLAEREPDPRTEAALSLELEDILKTLPPQQIQEIQNIVQETHTETRVAVAKGSRSVAVAGDVKGDITTGDTH